MRSLRRLVVALAMASAVAALASLAPPSPAILDCSAAGSHRAGIVVQHGDGSIATRCVAFGSDAVTAEQAVEESGLSWSVQMFGGFGAAVCALDGEPARYADCPGKDRYWAVFVSRGGAAWQLSAVGVSALELRDGDLAGFRYVPVAGTPAAPALPAGVCAAASTPAASRAATAPAEASAEATVPAPDWTTAGATAGATASPAPAITTSPSGSAPSGPSTPDPGLLAAAAAGGALAGLAALRLTAARRRSP